MKKFIIAALAIVAALTGCAKVHPEPGPTAQETVTVTATPTTDPVTAYFRSETRNKPLRKIAATNGKAILDPLLEGKFGPTFLSSVEDDGRVVPLGAGMSGPGYVTTVNWRSSGGDPRYLAIRVGVHFRPDGTIDQDKEPWAVWVSLGLADVFQGVSCRPGTSACVVQAAVDEGSWMGIRNNCPESWCSSAGDPQLIDEIRLAKIQDLDEGIGISMLMEVKNLRNAKG